VLFFNDYEDNAPFGNTEELIEAAGRTCYKSEDRITPGSAGEFVKGVTKRGHHSVIEHSAATFRIARISRACSHQLVRHRLMAISQESQRYCDEGDISQREYFVTPLCITDLKDVTMKELFPDCAWPTETVVERYELMIARASADYKLMQEIIKRAKAKGLCKSRGNEDARYLLPNACCTEVVITANFREYRHIFEQRCTKHAQWEIRAVAVVMLDMLNETAPHVFGDLQERIGELEDGTKGLVD